MLWTTLVFAPRYFMFALLATTPVATQGVRHISEWVQQAAIELIGSETAQRLRVQQVVMAVVLVVSTVASAASIKLANNDYTNLIFDTGSFFTSSPDRPPAGSTIYASTAKLHLWRDDYDWRPLPSDIVEWSIAPNHTTTDSSDTYILVETMKVCPEFSQWAGDSEFCGSALAHNPPKTLPGGHTVIKTFVRGDTSVWLIQLFRKNTPITEIKEKS